MDDDQDFERHPNAHGLPTSYELSDRLARVETKQDYVAEQLDEIGAKLDESVVSQSEIEEIENKVSRHHFAYRVGRLFIAVAAFLLSSSVVASVFF